MLFVVGPLEAEAHQRRGHPERPDRVDAVMDTTGQATWAHSVRALKPGGKIVISGATTGDAPPVPTATTTSPRSTIAGKMKVECVRSSITLTGRPTAFARNDIATPMSPAPAQTIAVTPPRSAANGSPSANSIPGLCANNPTLCLQRYHLYPQELDRHLEMVQD